MKFIIIIIIINNNIIKAEIESRWNTWDDRVVVIGGVRVVGLVWWSYLHRVHALPAPPCRPTRLVHHLTDRLVGHAGDRLVSHITVHSQVSVVHVRMRSLDLLVVRRLAGHAGD